MDFSLSSSLVGSAVSNPNKLALDLQFAADKTLTARKGPTPAFTRASSGTFVGSNGLIQSAGTNVARFDHNPVTLACKGLLIEESRTNLALQSGALVNNVGWFTFETILATSGTGPDGNTAYQATETTATSNHNFGNWGNAGNAAGTSIINGTTYTGSIFIKKAVGGVDWIQLTGSSAAFGTGQYANFNIGSGTIGNSAGLASGTSPRIEDYGNGWYRCSLSITATATVTSANLAIAFLNNTNGTTRQPSYAGSTNNKVLAAMCQFEAGAFPTSYIPTTTASVIRSADVCSISGSDFSGFYNPLEGTTLVSGDKTNSSNVSGSYFSYQSVAAEVGPFMTRSSIAILGRIRNNAALDLTNLDVSQSPSGEKKLAVAWKATSDSNDRAYCSGGVILPKTNPNAGTVANNQTALTIGNRLSASVFNGTISSLRYYKKRLSNAKLQTITV